MSRRPLPKLNQESLEALVVAIIRARDERGLAVRLMPEDVLLPEMLEQLPKTILGCNR